MCIRDREMKVEEVMSTSPKTIGENQTAAEAVGVMEFNAITVLVVTDKRNRVKGVVHLHDLLGREEFRLNGNYNPPEGAHR